MQNVFSGFWEEAENLEVKNRGTIDDRQCTVSQLQILRSGVH